jgi:hypothetical protein
MWSLTLRKNIDGCENRVLRRISRHTSKWWEAGEKYVMRSFITCTLHQILCDQIKEDEMGGAHNI